MDSLETAIGSTALMESLPHWAMLIDQNTRTVLSANRLAVENGARIGGQCWDDFCKRRFVPSHQLQMLQYFPGQERDNTVHCAFCQGDRAMSENRPQNREIPIDDTIWSTWWVPVDENAFLHYAMDVTDLKTAEKARVQAAHLESVLMTARAICHEINQPLHSLSMNLELRLMEMKESDPYFRDFQRMYEQVSRLTGMTRKLGRLIKSRTQANVNAPCIPGFDGASAGVLLDN